MRRLHSRYFIKVVPQNGEVVHRFELTGRRIMGVLLCIALLVAFAAALAALQVVRAHARVAALQSAEAAQYRQLRAFDRDAAQIRAQLRGVERQNATIAHTLGLPTPKPLQTPQRPQSSSITAHARTLAAQSDQTARESASLQALALRVINVRHAAALARTRILAAIPSIDPVDGAPVVGCFCYRSSPSPEFHPGVDLQADYGEVVHAAAAGVVASTGWDGGYGLKIDVDHQNGYHTWYAHLSRIDVAPGARVSKGQPIGLVGDTGFSTGAHLHYQVMLNGSPVDPTPYLHGSAHG